MRRLIYIIVCILAVFNGVSQEVLSELSSIQQLTKASKTTYKSKVIDTLPIFDDFSYESVFPNNEIWESSGVYVNNTYGIWAPSIGVATFDGVDDNGDVYEHLNSSPKLADSLSTYPIQLDVDKISTTYVTFYYQPQGNGKAPHFDDRLMLRLHSDIVDTVIWFANGCDFETFKTDSLGISVLNDSSINFKLVHIKLDNPLFFQEPVKLQFKNYVSIAGDHLQSGKTNASHWNIDYFMIRDDVSENDINFDDIAFIQPFDFFLNDYSSVPWSHYDLLINDELTRADNYIRNLSDKKQSLSKITLVVTDLSTQKVDSFSTSQTIEMHPQSAIDNWSWKEKAPVSYNGTSKADFKFEAKIFPQFGADFAQNNKVTRYFEFDNYYAHDDGSAEKAYGIDISGAQIAYKYFTYKRDTLRAVNFHFEKIQDASQKVESFKLCVWGKGTAGSPGELLRMQEGDTVSFSGNMNGFVTVNLKEPIVLEGEFFIGWEQTSDVLMNVGFDANTKSIDDRMYYKAYDNWYLSAYNNFGALMMRPVFGELTTGIKKYKAAKEFSVYPNPSNGVINFKGDASQGVVEIFNALGSLIYKGSLDERTVDLNQYKSGIYLVKIIADDSITEVHRIILTK